MQLVIELPDELGQELLRRGNVQQFIQQALEKTVLEEKKQNPAKQELQLLMSKVPNSVSLADELIRERRLQAKLEQQGNI